MASLNWFRSHWINCRRVRMMMKWRWGKSFISTTRLYINQNLSLGSSDKSQGYCLRATQARSCCYSTWITTIVHSKSSLYTRDWVRNFPSNFSPQNSQKIIAIGMLLTEIHRNQLILGGHELMRPLYHLNHPRGYNKLDRTHIQEETSNDLQKTNITTLTD